MCGKTRGALFAGVVTGSVWTFSEVVVGAVVRSTVLPLRGTVLTGIGVFLVLAAFGYTRRVRTVATAVLIVVIGRPALALVISAEVSITNGSLAVLILGSCILAAVSITRALPSNRVRTGLVAASAVLVSGTVFYATGTHFDPCPYLLQFTAVTFFLRETLPWALLSAVVTPAGYRAGRSLAERRVEAAMSPLPAWGVVAGCWLACTFVMVLIG